MNWETYVAFGDSITIGARTCLGYPERAGSLLGDRLSKSWNVINHAVSGYKAIDLARHIDLHFADLKEHKASISTILIGTNDIKEQTDPADFRIALDLVILKAKLLTTNKNVVVFTIPEFHTGIMYPYSIAMNAAIADFNDSIAALAEKHGIRCVTLAHTADDFLDGVHLNRAGVEHFATQVAQYILKDKGTDLG